MKMNFSGNRWSAALAWMILLLGLPGGVRAGTIVWDFDTTDSTTINLEAGAIDGDALAPEWWRYINDGVGSYLIADEFVFEDGWFTLTFSAYEEGSMPFQNHGSGIDVGSMISGGTELGLANVDTDYPYMIWYGELGWSTDNEIGSRFLFNVADRTWFGTQYNISFTPNERGRHVVDLSSVAQASGQAYGGTLNGFWWDVFGIWRTPTASEALPDFMAERWINEFDNDPSVTFLTIDWFALTDDPDFRSPGSQPTGALHWSFLN
ncbi:MAG TPA: hypothetical protein PK847_00890 [Candidatus Sumerlaeota bacterium]|nr:hypothetical protein [Candidatus Sumerlaeota bacterium]